MRLIFVEGVSGVGKSTLTQKLCDKLKKRGYAAASYLEGDFTNPIDLYCTAFFKQEEQDDLLAEYGAYAEAIKSNTIIAGDVRLVRYYNKETPLFPEPLLIELRKHEFCWKPVNPVPISAYTRVYKMVWERFTDQADTRLDYLLFDGSLLYHPINDMMQNYNASCDQITDHINSLIDVVNPLDPMVVYLSADPVSERLRKARVCRHEALPPAEQIGFWEARQQMDLSVMHQLPIPCDRYDISRENWDDMLDVVMKRIFETGEERRARIYPVILSEYNPAWPDWFAKEKENLERLIGMEGIAGIHHYGSTSVPGLTAKPTIDILLEINETVVIDKLIAALPQPAYICLSGPALTMPTPPPHVMFLKGYLTDGFAEQVFHIHVVYPGDHDELLFRDYLRTRADVAAEYAALKRRLFQDYEHDRDGYTAAKSAFIKTITAKAKN